MFMLKSKEIKKEIYFISKTPNIKFVSMLDSLYGNQWVVTMGLQS